LNYKKSSIENYQLTQEVYQKIKTKVYHVLQQLKNSYNPEAIRMNNDIEQGRDIILDKSDLSLFSGARIFEPTNLEQSLNKNDAKDRGKLRIAIE
jgi:hypothetical protein